VAHAAGSPIAQRLAAVERVLYETLASLDDERSQLRAALAEKDVEIAWLRRHVEVLSEALREAQRTQNDSLGRTILGVLASVLLAAVGGVSAGVAQGLVTPQSVVSVPPPVVTVVDECRSVMRSFDV
jgi:hypothetical protein